MIRQVLLAALAGGAIAFVFSAIQNSVFRGGEPRELPGQVVVLSALKAAIPEPGFYFFPGPALSSGMTKQEKTAAQADHDRRFKEGPTGILVYRTGGEDFQFGRRLAVQFLLGFFASLLAATILAITASATTYGTRALLVLLLGCFAFAYIEPQYWNWYGFPASYTMVRVLGGIVTWTAAGLAMAAIVH
jgi:hypothetical protein